MKILVINAGSSSLKYQLIDMADESVAAKGLVERIGIDGSSLVHKYGADGKFVLKTDIANHTVAMNAVLDALVDPEHGVLQSVDEIGAVGHRVLHGGDRFTASTIVDEPVEAAIEACIPLGPLHNPANLMGIRACRAVMPNTPQIAVFDTAFHQTMPPKAYLYGIPMEYYRKHAIRRYGFHGTSHRFVAGRATELLGQAHSRVIICHLGNGSSLSAVVDGQCVDTSMGLTPLEGVLMGTRSGSLDPAVVEYLCARENLTVSQVLNILNKKSGLLGLSERSSDMRDVLAGVSEGDEGCLRALESWEYSIVKYIGAFAAAMGGLDMLVFTAGIGENNAVLRERLTNRLAFLGVQVDHDINYATRDEADISTPDAKVRTWVIPTNEELAIARDTLELVTK